MGSCIICGVDIDGGGRICDPHQEDVVFDFRGDSRSSSFRTDSTAASSTATPNSACSSTSRRVTGLLHRSELDRRLDSLGWEPGDEVFVQVKGVRDNGNIDLAWSIRQADREFRGVLVQDGDTEHLPEEGGEESDAEADAEPDELDVADDETADASDDESADVDEAAEPDEGDGDVSAEADEVAKADEADDEGGADETDEGDESDADEGENESGADESAEDDDLDDERERRRSVPSPTPSAMRRGLTAKLSAFDRPAAPTVFEVLDETGVVDVAAFVEPGVRAYPDIEIGDAVRIDGEVESHRGDVQVESEALVLLGRGGRETVRRRLAEALTAEARPEGLQPLAGDETVAELADGLLDAAEAIRRAVLESRPIVVRHPATADGYVAGAAVERAVLPLIREEHAKSDAEYHYFTRRPLDDPVYGMDAATNDATRMLQDRDRHDEQLPLFLLVGTGSTTESADGIDLLSVYGVNAVVVDAEVADPETRARPSTRSSRPRSTGSTPTSRRARSSPRWPPRSTTKFERTSGTCPR